MSKKTLECFISYSHKDANMCETFMTYFKNLEREYNVTQWYDGKIPAGGNIDKEIQQHLATCDIIFLLISPHYISSDYCYCKELEVSIKRHEQGKCIIIPVIIREYDRGNYSFSHLKFVPTDGKPVEKFRNRNLGFADAFKSIRSLLQTFNTQTTSKEKNISRSNENLEKGSTSPTQYNPIKYKIVRRGKITTDMLSAELFKEITNYTRQLALFAADMNTLSMKQVELLKQVRDTSVQKRRQQLYRRNMEDFIVQLSGYIQQHFIGNENTGIHYRVKENGYYNDYYDIGYRSLGLPVDPIPADNGMISCSVKNKMPVIKSFNQTLHQRSHPNEKVERNYITFAFNDISDKLNIDLSMCISVVGSSSTKAKNIFTVMSIVRFDLLIEKYLLQYINQCSKTDTKYDVDMIFNSEV